MSEGGKKRSNSGSSSEEDKKPAVSKKTALSFALAASSKGTKTSLQAGVDMDASTGESKPAASTSDKGGESEEPPTKKAKTDTASLSKKEEGAKESAGLDVPVEQQKPPERLNFPGKLMDLLERKDKPEGIHWLPCGTIFAMNTTKMDDILVKHFQGAKFMSFTRTLNKW